MSTQTAELKFRYELTGDGLRAVNELTGEVVKLAKAEDIARERAEAMKKALASGPGVSALTGRPNSFDSGRPSPHGSPPRYMPPGVRRDNPLLDEVFGVQPSTTASRAPRPGDDLNRQRTGDPSLARAMGDLTMELRRLPEALRVAMGRSGPGASPSEVIPGRRQLSPSGASPGERQGNNREIQPRQPAPGGGGGFGFGFSAMMALDAAAGAARVDAQPFMTSSDRVLATAKSLPIIGGGISTLRDIQLFLQRHGSGLDRDEEAMKMLSLENFDSRVRRPFEDFRRQYDPRLRGIERGVYDALGDDRPLPVIPPIPLLRAVRPDHPEVMEARRMAGPGMADQMRKQIEIREAANHQAAMAERERIVRQRDEIEASRNGGLLSLPGLPSQQRTTLGERQQYDREMSLLPARDRQVLAQRELRMIEAQLAEKERLQKTHMLELQKANQLLARAREDEARPGGNVFTRMNALGRAVDATRMATTSQEQLKALDQDIFELKTQQAQQRGGVREADAGLIRAQLERMRERESVAADQSRSLALLGPAGRAQTEYAMRLIQESGDISMLPPEIVGMAQSAFPKTIGNLAEQAGQKFAGQFRDLAPDEYRDNLPDARKQVDELAAQVRKFEQTNPGQILKDTFDAIRGMASFYERLMQELEKFKQQIKAETEMQKANQ
jgi:hypothetical protein